MMLRTIAPLTGLIVALSAAPVWAQTEKEQDCFYQASVVAQIQNARMAKVKQKNVAAHIAETEQSWPEKYNNLVPLLSPWVYDERHGDISDKNLATAWQELCQQQ